MTLAADDSQVTILVDCRWLGLGGVGRVTEFLLTAWRTDPPPGRWILWGPRSVQSFLWPGASHIDGAPRSLPIADQIRLRRLPRPDLTLFLHQIHPLPSTPYVTVIHDTTPLRWGGSRSLRLAKRVYLTALARGCAQIITVSEFSAQNIVGDLGVSPTKVEVLSLPEDAQRSQRVRALRLAREPERFTFYLGRFARHKNLDRLIRVFPTTEFARSGGGLKLVGGEGEEVRHQREVVESLGAGDVIDVLGVIPGTELDALYATAAFLTVPSYEEGYGLPPREALSVGLPVCISTGGALAELVPYASASFDPHSDEALRVAIDRVASGARPAADYPRGPDQASYGRRVAEIVVRAARQSVSL